MSCLPKSASCFVGAKTPTSGKSALSASQCLAEARCRGIFLGAKPPMRPLQASIAPAIRQVVNAFITYRPQRQLGFDRASRRHGGVGAEKLLTRLILLAGFATPAEKSRAIRLPSPEVARVRETSTPQPAPVLPCVSFLRRETALCRRLQFDRPSFPNEPLVERGGLAFERANPDPPVLVIRIRPLVVASNGARSNMRAQSISRRNPHGQTSPR